MALQILLDNGRWSRSEKRRRTDSRRAVCKTVPTTWMVSNSDLQRRTMSTTPATNQLSFSTAEVYFIAYIQQFEFFNLVKSASKMQPVPHFGLCVLSLFFKDGNDTQKSANKQQEKNSRYSTLVGLCVSGDSMCGYLHHCVM